MMPYSPLGPSSMGYTQLTFFLKKRGGEGTPLMAHLSLLSAKVGRYEDVGGEPTHDMY